MKKHFILLALSFSLFGLSSCEEWITPETCAAYKTAADLFMDDRILVDGQSKQNLLIHNLRTGEIFFGGESPVHDFQTGDWLEIGVVIFNDFISDECNFGADAPPTVTAPTAYRQSGGQAQPYPLSLAWTPGISNGGYEISVAEMQFLTGGNYYFDFQANQNRQVDEHSFSNNFYNSTTQGYGLTGEGGSAGRMAPIRVLGEQQLPGAGDRSAPIRQREVASPEAAHASSALVKFVKQHYQGRIKSIRQ
ncbi:MAG: hypothetical protein SFV22_16690 [Saprospiraceae bacterium]|nr:hypothetical protein [Saprospiraceae bacterium]